jgi:hypothetical protein
VLELSVDSVLAHALLGVDTIKLPPVYALNMWHLVDLVGEGKSVRGEYLIRHALGSRKPRPRDGFVSFFSWRKACEKI